MSDIINIIFENMLSQKELEREKGNKPTQRYMDGVARRG